MLNTDKMLDIRELASAEVEYVDELAGLSDRALRFVESNAWCTSVVRGMFDRGWGNILAVFYFVIQPAYDYVPRDIWVVVGDLPSAHIDIQDNPNGACAIDGYVREMQRWIDQVMKDRSPGELIPVDVLPTREYAQELQRRIDIVTETILTDLKDEIEAGINGVTSGETAKDRIEMGPDGGRAH
jgi:hypothetical protein